MVISIENSHTWIDIRHVKYDDLHLDLFVWLIKLSHSPHSVHAFAAPFTQQPQSLSKISGKSPQYKRFHLHNIFSWMEPHLLIWHQASGGNVTEKLWHHRNRFDNISFLADSAIFAALANSAIMRSDFGGSLDTCACHIGSGWEFHGCISKLHTRKFTAGTPWDPTMQVWTFILFYLTLIYQVLLFKFQVYFESV